jgi:hypothetical protein
LLLSHAARFEKKSGQKASSLALALHSVMCITGLDGPLRSFATWSQLPM